MSIQTNSYVMLGVMLPFEKGDDVFEKYEKYMDSAYKPKKSGFVLLYDGMCGNYIAAGHVLASTDCETMGFDAPVTVDPTVGDIKAVEVDLYAKMGIKDADVKILVISHLR